VSVEHSSTIGVPLQTDDGYYRTELCFVCWWRAERSSVDSCMAWRGALAFMVRRRRRRMPCMLRLFRVTQLAI